jgi:predicted GIY-YIG superfamily endonuclease
MDSSMAAPSPERLNSDQTPVRTQVSSPGGGVRTAVSGPLPVAPVLPAAMTQRPVSSADLSLRAAPASKNGGCLQTEQAQTHLAFLLAELRHPRRINQAPTAATAATTSHADRAPHTPTARSGPALTARASARPALAAGAIGASTAVRPLSPTAAVATAGSSAVAVVGDAVALVTHGGSQSVAPRPAPRSGPIRTGGKRRRANRGLHNDKDSDDDSVSESDDNDDGEDSGADAKAAGSGADSGPSCGPGFWVYVLESQASPHFSYIGFTVDRRRRLRQHNGELVGGAKYTKMRGPWKMVMSISGSGDWWTKIAALQLEWRAKHVTKGRSRRRPKMGNPEMRRWKTIRVYNRPAVERRINDIFWLLHNRRKWTRGAPEWQAGRTLRIELEPTLITPELRKFAEGCSFWTPQLSPLSNPLPRIQS